VVEVLSGFTSKYPDITVNLSVNLDVLNMTDENIDVAFRSGPLPDSTMIAITLFSMQPVFCATPEAIEKYGFPQTVKELTKFPMIIQNNINIVKKARTSFPEFKDLDISQQHTSNDLVANMNMLKSGMGTTFLLRHMVEKELQEGALIELIPDVKIPQVPVHLMYQKLNYMPKKIRYFIDYFKAEFMLEAK